MDNSLELPNEVVINGVKYQRVSDYSNDDATGLLRRIRGVAAETNTSLELAAWAIRLTAFGDVEPPTCLANHFSSSTL